MSDSPDKSQMPSASDSKAQPARKLPTDRIAFQKQLDILRAYGVSSQGGTRAVNYKDVALVVQMSPSTVALMNTWMTDIGLVERSGNDFVPARALVEYAQAHSWTPETAATKLAPAFRKTWFGERLVTRLGFRSMTVDEVVADLAQQISAPPNFRPQIETLVDFACASGLVRREGNLLTLGEEAAPVKEATKAASETVEAEQEMPSSRGDSPSRGRVISTGFMTSPEGRVQFHVSIDVSMKEMADWSPDRISAFFSGLAQALAAKHGAEKV